MLHPLVRPGILIALTTASFVVAAQGAQTPASNQTVDETQALAGEHELTYVIKNGDTLIGITRRLLKPEFSWRHLQALNQRHQPNQVFPGATLRIPLSWIRPKQVSAKIISVSGPVFLRDQPANVNDEAIEEDPIRTGKTGVVRVRLPDGTVIRVAPSSSVRIDRLRAYFGNETVEARVRLEHGVVDTKSLSAEETAKFGVKNRRIEIQTPKATAAVRGTEFRVVEGDERASSAVRHGRVAWGGSGASLSLAAGFGSSADASGSVSEPETLLPAPALNAPSGPIRKTSLHVPIVALKGAGSYRIRLAADALFSRDLKEFISKQALLSIASAKDGAQYYSVNAISKNGVEGYARQGNVVFAARPVAPTLNTPSPAASRFESSTRLSWHKTPQASSYRVQVSTDAQFKNIVFDRTVEGDHVTYTGAPTQALPRHRYWRIATLRNDKQGPYTGKWGFVQRQNGPKIDAAVNPSKSTARLSWPATPEAQSYRIKIVPTSVSASEKRVLVSNQADILVTNLAPGSYQAWVFAEYGNGVSSPKGPAHAFDVSLLLRDGSGKAVQMMGQPIIGIKP